MPSFLVHWESYWKKITQANTIEMLRCVTTKYNHCTHCIHMQKQPNCSHKTWHIGIEVVSTDSSKIRLNMCVRVCVCVCVCVCVTLLVPVCPLSLCLCVWFQIREIAKVMSPFSNFIKFDALLHKTHCMVLRAGTADQSLTSLGS